MAIYECVKLPRDMRHLSASELKAHYKDDGAWQPSGMQQIPAQIETIEALSEIGFKLDNRDIRTISRAIAYDGLYVGKSFIVRQVEGVRLGV